MAKKIQETIGNHTRQYDPERYAADCIENMRSSRMSSFLGVLMARVMTAEEILAYFPSEGFAEVIEVATPDR
jgi:hypothetical protein